MAPSSSTPADIWSFLTSNHPASTVTRSVATAALAGGLTYYVTRPSSTKSIDPKQPPEQDDGTASSSSTPATAKDIAPGDPKPPPKPASKLRTKGSKDHYTSASESGSEDEGKRVRFEGPQRPFSKPLPIAVFWDVDVGLELSALSGEQNVAELSSDTLQNCSPPTGSSGRHLVQAIRKHLSAIDTGTGPDKEELGQPGPILSFKAYLELSSAEGVGPAQVTLRSELQGSGVSLIDTPKSGRKDVADKMIIADIMAFALDVPPPARIVLISGDRDFAYPLSLIRGRGYQVILITPPVGAVPILEASANHVARWRQDVLGMERDGYGRLYSNANTPTKPYQRSSSPGPSGRKTPPPPGSQPMSTSTSQQSAQGKNGTSASASSTAPAQPPAPPVSTSLSGPGAAPVPGVFQPLVQALEEFRREGQPRPLRSKVAIRLTAIDKDVYEKAGASSWRDYVAVAVAAGIVVVGGNSGATGYEWIALRTVDSQLFQTRPASGVAAGGAPVTPVKRGLTQQASTATLKSATSPWNKDDEDKDDDTVSATDGIYTPPPAFEPLFDAIIEAEKVTGRTPPYTDTVGECLHKAITTGKMSDPFGPLGVKSFGAYITAAFKSRVAKLTPSETKDRAALAVMPVYQAHLDSLRRGGNASANQRTAPSTPSSVAKDAGGLSPTKKGGLLPNVFKKGSKNSVQESPSSSKGTSNSKKSSAYDKPGLLVAHQPSGEKIASIYFPLANVLCVEREKGNLYSTDSFLYGIISKHKHIGGQVKNSDAFAKYLNDAVRDDIVTIEPGFKAGVRHVRLAARLQDPKEKDAAQSGERLPPAGADPYTTSPPRAIASFSKDSTATNDSQPGSDTTATGGPVIATEAPSVEDRKRFKPLMDVMFALRKYDPPITAPRRSMVYNLLTKKHCPDSSSNGDPEAMLAWLGEHGASSIGDYTRQAEKFGFVVLGREERDDGVQGKKTVRLAEKYELRL